MFSKRLLKEITQPDFGRYISRRNIHGFVTTKMEICMFYFGIKTTLSYAKIEMKAENKGLWI